MERLQRPELYCSESLGCAAVRSKKNQLRKASKQLRVIQQDNGYRGRGAHRKEPGEAVHPE